MFQGSIVALATPMNADGRIDYDAWSALVDWHLDAGTAGIVVAGTTGESPVLSGDEFTALLDAAAARCRGRIPVLAGTGGADTKKVVAQTRQAAGHGADAVLVVTPYYNRPPQRGLEAHYRTVADASPVPLVLYNVPGRTGCDLHPETSLRLLEHPGIVGLKEAVADPGRVSELVAGAPEEVCILSGDDPSACRSMQLGAHGVISVAANIAPAAMAELCRLAVAGEDSGAAPLDARLAGLYDFLAVESNPIPVKWLLHRMGRAGSGIRLPLMALDERYRARADELIAALDLK